MKLIHAIVQAILSLLLFCSFSLLIDIPSKVIIVGQMSDVMWKGELQGKIDLDTISEKKHLYGMGPIEFLSGEIIILDGRAYYSYISEDSTIHVKESYEVKAPFFAYATIPHWTEMNLQESVRDIKSLENYLNATISEKKINTPFFFLLKGKFSYLEMHIVNLPKGKKVSSPNEAHEGMRKFNLNEKEVTILGFYSTKHQRIFTHHDTNLHLHVLTDDTKMLGHVEDIVFDNKDIKFFIPKGLL